MINSTGDIILYGVLFLSLYFQVFLMFTYVFQSDKEKNLDTIGAKRVPYAPTVDIIVPCYNEEKSVEKTIESLLALEYDSSKLRILVIDDGSRDKTWEIVQKYRDHSQIVLFQKINEGSKFSALNYGLARAHAEIVGCLDADSRVDSQALKYSIEEFETTGAHAITPVILIDQPKTLLQIIQKTEFELAIFIKKMFNRADAIYLTPGPFSLFRREVFSIIGNYREAHHTEDFEIALRLRSHGMKIGYSSRTKVYTMAHTRFKNLWKQRIRWTYGHFRNVHDYKHLVFDPRMGEMGMFVLPFSTITMISTIAIYIGTSTLLIRSLIRRIEEVALTGFDIPTGISLFYLDVRTHLILSVLVLSFTMFVIYKGRSIVNIRRISPDMVYGTLLYGFVAPFWVGVSFVKALRGKQGVW